MDVNLPEPTKEETVAFEEKMWKQVAEKDPRFEGGWEARAVPSSTPDEEMEEIDTEMKEIEEEEGEKDSQAKFDFVGVNYDVR